MYTDDPRRDGVVGVREGVVARAAECLPVPIEAKLRPVPPFPCPSLLMEFRDSDRVIPPPPVFVSTKNKQKVQKNRSKSAKKEVLIYKCKRVIPSGIYSSFRPDYYVLFS